MHKLFLAILLGLLWTRNTAAADPTDGGSSAAPLIYDLMINGESFRVEANRQTRLESRAKPGVSYDVALQIAIEQQVRLEHVRFDYEWPATVQETRQGGQRAIRLRHELGFTILLSDLGGNMEESSRSEGLKILADSVVGSLRQSGMKEVAPTAPREWKFANATARGVSIAFKDSQGAEQTAQALLMSGPGFTASCVVQYFNNSAALALPRAKKILDSIRANKQ